jgi:predicted nucleotidyltransferase
MMPYALKDCPPAVERQIEAFVLRCQEILNDDLRGVYLHGSLALGCFNPARSDIDLLVITHQPLSVDTKRLLAEEILRRSNAPRPLEISCLHSHQLRPWRYPTPYDFHFSEDWRARIQDDLQSEGWRRWNDEEKFDGDLVAHFTVTRQRGIRLWGEPIASVIPVVPAEDYRDSLLSDLAWARDRATKLPVYGILNHCRVYAYMAEGHIYSKQEGAHWALERLPAEFHALIASALDAYQGNDDPAFDEGELLTFMSFVADRIARLQEQTVLTRSRLTGS